MGDRRARDAPTPVDMHVTSVVVECGRHFSAAITTAGRLYTWGDNRCGQLGVDRTTNECCSSPTRARLPASDTAEAVACGAAHTLVLCKSGVVYSCGSNEHGQLGVADVDEFLDRPQRVVNTGAPQQTVVAVAAGDTQ